MRGSVLQAKGKREQGGDLPVALTAEERDEKGRQRQKRREEKMKRGKRTYQYKKSGKYCLN